MSEPNDNALGSNLRAARERAGLSQQVVANRAGMSRSYVAELETGRVPNPGVLTLAPLLIVLGLTFREALNCEPLRDS